MMTLDIGDVPINKYNMPQRQLSGSTSKLVGHSGDEAGDQMPVALVFVPGQIIS